MSYYMQQTSGLGAVATGGGGSGGVAFDAGAVWSDWLAGAAGNNAAGMRAADKIRAALGQLGYGSLTLGVMWGSSADKSAYTKFQQTQSIPPGQTSWWPTQVGVTRLGELVAQGGNPGGGAQQQFHTSGDQIIPGAAPGSASASGGMSVGLIAAAVVLVGGVVVLASKKKHAGAHPTHATPNSRGSRRRGNYNFHAKSADDLRHFARHGVGATLRSARAELRRRHMTVPRSVR